MYLGDVSTDSYHSNASECDIPDFEQRIICQAETTNERITAAQNRVKSVDHDS